MLHISSFMKTAILILCPVATLLPAGIAAPATSVAQTRAENAARCGGDDLDIALTGCTALIQSGQEQQQPLPPSISIAASPITTRASPIRLSPMKPRQSRSSPILPPAYYDRGEAYLKQGLTDQAIADLHQGDRAQVPLRRSLFRPGCRLWEIGLHRSGYRR